MQMVTAKVLVMDDEPEVLEVVASFLEMMGCRADTSLEGNEALRLFEKSVLTGEPYDLLILDLTVPEGLDGKTVMKRIREKDKGILGIVSSGVSVLDQSEEYKEWGFNAVISKPYRIDALNRLICSLLGR